MSTRNPSTTRPTDADYTTTSRDEAGDAPRDEPRDAPMMFATDNRVTIRGHFDAESDERPF